MVPLAVVWHYWLSLILAISSVGLVVGVIIMYLVIVQKPKYPRKP